MKQKINSLLGGRQWESNELVLCNYQISPSLTFPSDIFFHQMEIFQANFEKKCVPQIKITLKS